jgi:hypothetical protein
MKDALRVWRVLEQFVPDIIQCLGIADTGVITIVQIEMTLQVNQVDMSEGTIVPIDTLSDWRTVGFCGVW